MSKILTIDTSGSFASVAFFDDNFSIREACSTEQQKHLQSITSLIDQVLNGDKPDCIALVGGPGSYTGLRIGASVSKALSLAWSIPIVMITSLEALAHTFIFSNSHLEGMFCPMIDARRMEVFTAVYNSSLDVIFNPQPVILDQENDWKNFLSEKSVVHAFGNGANKLLHLNQSYPSIQMYDQNIQIQPASIAALGFEKYKKGNYEDVAYFTPFYSKGFWFSGNS